MDQRDKVDVWYYLARAQSSLHEGKVQESTKYVRQALAILQMSLEHERKPKQHD